MLDGWVAASGVLPYHTRCNSPTEKASVPIVIQPCNDPLLNIINIINYVKS